VRGVRGIESARRVLSFESARRACCLDPSDLFEQAPDRSDHQMIVIALEMFHELPGGAAQNARLGSR
jgi:hypothetical protein